MVRTPIAFPPGQVLQRSMAAQIAQTANRYQARIMVERGDKIVNAKSMLGLLSLGAGEADTFVVVDGEDESPAAEAIEALLKKLFT